MKKIDFDKLEMICSNMNLLYVEDDIDVMNSTLEIIKEFFHTVYTAEDGETALHIFRKEVIDIVISDITIPKINGIELTSILKKEKKDLFVIMLSAHEESEYIISSLKNGVDGYLIKPLELEKFSDIIMDIGEKKKDKTVSKDFAALGKEITKGSYKYVVLLDISNFSIINKLYGKVFGDLILDLITKRLKSEENERFQLFKVDSDKFIFLSKEENLQKIKEYIEKIKIDFIEEPVFIENVEIDISFNAGASKITHDMQELINAEFALQHAKEIHCKEVFFFDSKNESILKEKENIVWIELTKQIIKDKSIYPYFQPILNIDTQKIEKYEVLARAIHEKEIIPPIFFIPAAEKLGLITEITKIIIEKSFQFFKDTDYKFSINLSGKDFQDKYLCDFLKVCLEKNNIKPENVTFEILENITIEEKSLEIINQINKLKEGGFHIAIDDFGADNSNFSRLIDIDCDLIKIDRIFIKNIASNEKHKIIVKTIVNLAKMLGVKTVAEYVENEEILRIIKECGVDYAQGYLIGKPEDFLLS